MPSAPDTRHLTPDTPRLAVASIMHEGNTFAPTRTTLAEFEQSGLVFGQAVVTRFTGTNTELGGFFAALANESVEVAPLLAASAIPGGILTRECFEWLRRELAGRLRAAGAVDGVLLAIHGALIAEGYDSGDGELLAMARQVVGPNTPIVATFDMHANLTSAIVDNANMLIGYDLLPHTDAGEKGEKAARLLLRQLRGEIRPTMAWRKLPLITTPENGHTLFGPMADLVALAKRLETRPGVLSASLAPVQAWLDVPNQGWSTLVVTDNDAALADKLAAELAREAWSRRHDFAVDLYSVEEAYHRALTLPRGPAIFANSADNTGGGAPGDNTAVLSRVLGVGCRVSGVSREATFASKLPESASPGRPGSQPPIPDTRYPTPDAVLLTLVDAEVVAVAIRAGVGSTVTVEVGGKLDHVNSQPVRVEAYVRTITDGRYRYTGTQFTGVEVNLGRTVVLVIGAIHLLVSEQKGMTIDPALYRSVGLDPARARIVGVKTASGFRAGYGEMAQAVFTLDTPGYCPPNLRSLDWRRVPRPIWPLDDAVDYIP